MERVAWRHTGFLAKTLYVPTPPLTDGAFDAKGRLATYRVSRETLYVPTPPLTDGRIRFADLFRLTQQHGVEFGLAREMVNGRAVYRLYSGGANAVTIGESGNQVLRVIGHTHPSGIGLPSGADIRNINGAFLNALETDPYARVPVRIIIWGPGAGQTTPYYPNVLR